MSNKIKEYHINRWQKLAGILKENTYDGVEGQPLDEEWQVVCMDPIEGTYVASEPLYSLEEAQEMLKKIRIKNPDKHYELEKNEHQEYDPTVGFGVSSDFE